MKVPYWLKGAIFAPTVLALLFFLKLTCSTDTGCFADVFTTPAFLPLTVVYKIFGPVYIVSTHEPEFLLLYWAVIGLLVGLIFDMVHKETQKETTTTE